jgi:tetratricopeptide (TPR) repeat protein
LLERLPRALNEYRDVDDSETIEMAHLLGQVLEQIGDYTGALAHFGLLIEQQKDGLWVRLHRARLYRQLGRIRQAATELERATEFDPEHGEIAHERRRHTLWAMREKYHQHQYGQLIERLPAILVSES